MPVTLSVRILALFLLVSAAVSYASIEYRTLEWSDLIPPDVDQAVVSGFVEHGTYITDNSIPAPVDQTLQGQASRLPGFVVPLEGDENGITEFLLVPFMGACIHVPPPPSNQIVYVRSIDTPLQFEMIYDAIWVSGVISVENIDSELALAGYQMSAHSFEFYQFQQ